MDTTEERKTAWIAFYEAVVGGASERSVGQAIGENNMYVRRHLTLKETNDTPTAEAVVKWAEVYAQNPVVALMRAGYFTPADIQQASGSINVRHLSTDDLLTLMEAVTAELKSRFGNRGFNVTTSELAATDAQKGEPRKTRKASVRQGILE